MCVAPPSGNIAIIANDYRQGRRCFRLDRPAAIGLETRDYITYAGTQGPGDCAAISAEPAQGTECTSQLPLTTPSRTRKTLVGFFKQRSALFTMVSILEKRWPARGSQTRTIQYRIPNCRSLRGFPRHRTPLSSAVSGMIKT